MCRTTAPKEVFFSGMSSPGGQTPCVSVCFAFPRHLKVEGDDCNDDNDGDDGKQRGPTSSTLATSATLR